MQVLSISTMISEGGMGGMEMGAPRQSAAAWEGRQCQSTMKSWQEQLRVDVPTFQSQQESTEMALQRGRDLLLYKIKRSHSWLPAAKGRCSSSRSEGRAHFSNPFPSQETPPRRLCPLSPVPSLPHHHGFTFHDGEPSPSPSQGAAGLRTWLCRRLLAWNAYHVSEVQD